MRACSPVSLPEQDNTTSYELSFKIPAATKSSKLQASFQPSTAVLSPSTSGYSSPTQQPGIAVTHACLSFAFDKSTHTDRSTSLLAGLSHLHWVHKGNRSQSLLLLQMRTATPQQPMRTPDHSAVARVQHELQEERRKLQVLHLLFLQNMSP